MPDQNEPKPKDKNNTAGSPMVTTPSQAEGEREHVEETLGQNPRGDMADTAPKTDDPMAYTPSQAEGEREHVEETLQEKD